MKKNNGLERCEEFVKSIVNGLVISILSVLVTFLLYAPLLTFVKYGFFSGFNNLVNNMIMNRYQLDSLSLTIMIIQVLLTIGFLVTLYIFMKKVIYVFIGNEKLVRPYYTILFFMVTLVPPVIIFLSVLLGVKLLVLILVVEGIFLILDILLAIFTKKILPDIKEVENRKYLFSAGVEND